MRIPSRNIYRAFPELDVFSDEQCMLLMRRVRINFVAQLAIFVLTMAALVCAFAVSTTLVTAIDLSWLEARLSFQTYILTRLLLVFVPTGAAALLTRDAVLRASIGRAMRREIERIRCLGCRHILIGQRVVDDAVRCPECGEVWALHALGIVADDLIPPTSQRRAAGPPPHLASGRR